MTTRAGFLGSPMRVWRISAVYFLGPHNVFPGFAAVCSRGLRNKVSGRFFRYGHVKFQVVCPPIFRVACGGLPSGRRFHFWEVDWVLAGSSRIPKEVLAVSWNFPEKKICAERRGGGCLKSATSGNLEARNSFLVVTGVSFWNRRKCAGKGQGPFFARQWRVSTLPATGPNF